MGIKRLISFHLQKVYNPNNTKSQIRMRIHWLSNVVQFNIGYNIVPTTWDSKMNDARKILPTVVRRKIMMYIKSNYGHIPIYFYICCLFKFGRKQATNPNNGINPHTL